MVPDGLNYYELDQTMQIVIVRLRNRLVKIYRNLQRRSIVIIFLYLGREFIKPIIAQQALSVQFGTRPSLSPRA